MRFLLGPLVAACLLVGCKTNNVDTAAGAVQLTFDNRVNGNDLKLGTGTYQNASGEAFTVTKFDYFISNIRFIRPDGSIYTLPQDNSYFLIREGDPASQQVTLPNIPAGNYTQIEFMVGVDSLRNVSNVSKRTGVLDPAGSHTSGMYWDWNTGYIHLKLEGTSPQAPLDATGNRNIRYHIGFFGGYQTRTLNNLRTVRVPLGLKPTSTLSVGPGLETQLTIHADAGKLFDGPTPIRIAQYPDVMIAPISATVANNYATMFSFGFSMSVTK